MVLTETIIGPVGISAEGPRRRYAVTPTTMFMGCTTTLGRHFGKFA